MEYRILLDRKQIGKKNGIGYITLEGALIIWEAYKKLNPYTSQTMNRREERGGVCWLSEIKLFKDQGFLPYDFDWTAYMIRIENFK
jgi:hypothetical protein